MDEKEIPPELTSGTPDRVVVVGSQVTRARRSNTAVRVSSGRTVFPITKQAGDCLMRRGAMAGMR